jgi:O-acetylserine/cysteine efflux transporter
MPLSHAGLALFVVFLWGMHFVVIQVGLEYMSPWVMIAMRIAGSVLFFMPFVRFSWQRFRQFWPFGIWVNLIHILSLFLMVDATDSSTTALILNGYIVLVVLASWLIYKEQVRWPTIVGIGMAVVGLVFIYGAPTMTFWGMIISVPFLISAMMREVTLRNIDRPTPFELIGYGSLCVLPLIVPYSLIVHGDDWAALSFEHTVPLLAIFTFQVFVTGASLVLWQWLLARNDLSKVVPINLAQPFFAVAGAVLFLGQELSTPLVMGGALVVIGVGVHLILGRARKSEDGSKGI